MAGLNDLVTNKELQTTSLPGWYSTAQQNLVNQTTGVNAPALGDTAAQSAVSAFGTGSPFTSGQNILQTIGSGAANPWLVTTDATGAQTVSPNVATPLGGLFAAQKDYLGQIMPDIDVAATAPAIASGGFGSRMNLSGIAREREKAFSDLAQKQMQAALQAQQTGVAAGAGLGNIGQGLVKSALETGTYQQNAPYAGAVNVANILSKVSPEKNIEKSIKLGGLNQIMGLLAGTQGGLNALMGRTVTDSAGNKVVLPGLIEQIRRLYSGGGGEQPGMEGTTELTNPSQPGDESYGWRYFSDGTVISPSGDYYRNGELVYSPPNTYESPDYSFWDDTYGSDSGSGGGGQYESPTDYGDYF